jgi:hypothetical protein
VVISAIIGCVFFAVDDDPTVRRQVLVQGVMAAACSVAYGIYVSKYEKSRKEYLKERGIRDEATGLGRSSAERKKEN